jgi:hypothetical protein
MSFALANNQYITNRKIKKVLFPLKGRRYTYELDTPNGSIGGTVTYRLPFVIKNTQNRDMICLFFSSKIFLTSIDESNGSELNG